MWPPENWRQIHHSDKIDMNKNFKGNFIDTHRYSVMYNSFEYIYSYVHKWTTVPRTVTGNKKKIIQLEHASSFPTICLEFDLNFFFCSCFFCGKIIYRWNEKFNVLVISICLGTMVHITYNRFPNEKPVWKDSFVFAISKVCVANNFWWS